MMGCRDKNILCFNLFCKEKMIQYEANYENFENFENFKDTPSTCLDDGNTS